MKRLVLSIFFLILLGSAMFGQTNYYLIVNGDPTVLIDWGIQPDGTGTPPPSFNAGNNWYITDNNPNLTLNASWSLGAGETIFIGDGFVSTTFILGTGAALPNGPTVFVNDFGIFDIEENFSFGSLSNYNAQPGSLVIYGASSPNVGTWNTPYYDLEIANSNTLNSSITVGNNLTLQSNLFLNGNTITIDGVVFGTGAFDGGTTNNSGLILNGGGCDISFNTGVGQRLAKLTLNLDNTSDVVRLGSDLNLNGTGTLSFSLTQGVLDLNGKQLVCATPITFNSNASIKASSNSTLSILGTSSQAITNSLLMASSGNTLLSLVMGRPSRTLTIGNALNVADNVSVTAGTIASGGNLTLLSTSSLKGRIGTSSGTITGNISVQTFVPGASTGWAQWGSGGIQNQTVANWDGQIPMTCNGCINGTAAVSPGGFHSVQGWSEPADDYDLGITSGTSLTPGRGFWVYVGSGQVNTTDFTLVNTGPPVMGAGTITLSASVNKFNLIANPYASPISWNALRSVGTNTAKVTNAIYGWNADLNGGAGGAVDFVGGASNGMTDVIAAGQGFYVESINGAAIDYDESIKSTANTGANQLIKTTTTDIGQIAHLKLEGNGLSDQTIIRLHSDASTNFDIEWDARKRFHSPGYVGFPGQYSYYTTISTRLQGEDYSINSIASPNGTLAIPVLARVTSSGTYSISAFDFDGYNSCLVLRDKLNNSYQDLRLAPYVFYMSDTTSSPRFEIIVCESVNTAIATNQLSSSPHIFIFQDEAGAVVKTNFPKETKAVISIYNMLGQQAKSSVFISGTETTTQLDLDNSQQIWLIKVTTESETVTKKLISR